ncbi:hypothetical protein [Muribaculum intestinale]|uniref:hypothetical protein n=1 Tax=Muribaculum intestinale TaxID=1796646 RepID=UPI00263A7DD5|nr:hypothetical protein [Muribaculum intestinale]
MRTSIILLICVLNFFSLSAEKKAKVIKISVQPKEAAIYVDNSLIGYGYGEFSRPPKKNQVAIIRVECNEYTTANSKFYGGDERNSLSFNLMQDGFYRGSASSGLVNKFITVSLDKQYYSIDENGKINTEAAWKLLHQILLNYFPEIETSDFYGGYMQTPWKYKSFNMSEKQLRNRVTVRDITTPERVAFQIKISSEVAGAMQARHGEFDEIDRLPKELEPMVEELQTRIGKASSI